MRAMVVESYFLFVSWSSVCVVSPDATRCIGPVATDKGESRQWYFRAGRPASQENISPMDAIRPE
jgi:hypothetical protein